MAKERPSKRLRSDATDFPTEFSTNKPTVQQQAESFLAVTAEIPFSALTCQWRNGFNRRLQNKHVVGLCNAFESDSVRRGVEANFLLVQCGSDAIARMLEHLQSETRWDGDSKDAVCFSDWERINPNVKLEREPARKTSCGGRARSTWQASLNSSGGARWRLTRGADKLPPDLDQQLRMNRRDVMLPDSDGEIWSQVVQAQDRDKTLFDGNKATTMKRLRAALQLGGDFKFPVDRVVTLWNNAPWREMLRRWSETEVGRGNFSVYMFEWMASLRIDGVRV
ncbi:hypothetical protein PWT90_05750 [Aphanocladium album]|nr:hypothetical protein PWT90_05750 [Aphanocladium album]